MAEMSKKKETREAAVVPQPLRIDEDMLVTPRDEVSPSILSVGRETQLLRCIFFRFVRLHHSTCIKCSMSAQVQMLSAEQVPLEWSNRSGVAEEE